MINLKNILLIDDDEDYVFLTKHSLDRLHIFEKVTILTNGNEALDFITNQCTKPDSEECPGVIFVDNQMPGMNGFTFLEKMMNIAGIIKENFQIFMVSSFINDADMEKLKKYEIQGFIDKPLSVDKLKKIFH